MNNIGKKAFWVLAITVSSKYISGLKTFWDDLFIPENLAVRSHKNHDDNVVVLEKVTRDE